MSSRLAPPFVALLCCVSSATSAAPQQSLEPMRLDLKDVAVEKILTTFARVTGSRLERDPAVSGSITFRFDHLSWETALNAICDSARCTWRLEQRGSQKILRVVPSRTPEEEGKRVTLSLKYASARQVFEVLAGLQELELELDPTLEGEFTFSFERVGFSTVMDALCENVGCTWSRQVDPGVLTVSRTTAPPHLDGQPTASDRLGERISIDVKDADVREVLSNLARVLSAETDMLEEVRGAVTLELEEATLGEALDVVCDQVFLRWSLGRRRAGKWFLTVRPIQGDFGDQRSGSDLYRDPD